MTDEQLNKLIDSLRDLRSETEVVEFKVNNSDPKQIGKRISALANSANLHGKKRAFLVFGIEDGSHDPVGTSFKPREEKIGNCELGFWLSQKLNPDVDFEIREIVYEGEDIVVVVIPPAIDQPIKFENIAYIRNGSATPKLSDYPNKERKIWDNINRRSFEKGIALEGLSGSEVMQLLDYSKYFSLTKQDLPSDVVGFVDRMADHGLVRKELNDLYDITNLGALLFANDLTNFPSVKRKAMRVVVYEGRNRDKRLKEQEGAFGYAVSFEGLIDYILDQLPQNEEISKTLRKQVKMYPDIAIRELIANALIHQDLTISGTGPMVEIFDDRVEIVNPGIPLIDTDRFIDHPPRSRNEDLASFMRQIGVCEEGGTGIDRALYHVAIYQLPAPSFQSIEDGFTKVVLYAHKSFSDMTMEDKVRACFQHCVLKHVENSRMTNASLRERLDIPESNYPAASAIIRAARDAGLIKSFDGRKEYVPFWV